LLVSGRSRVRLPPGRILSETDKVRSRNGWFTPILSSFSLHVQDDKTSVFTAPSCSFFFIEGVNQRRAICILFLKLPFFHSPPQIRFNSRECILMTGTFCTVWTQKLTNTKTPTVYFKTNILALSIFAPIASFN
jgi:hypothetical protein